MGLSEKSGWGQKFPTLEPLHACVVICDVSNKRILACVMQKQLIHQTMQWINSGDAELK